MIFGLGLAWAVLSWSWFYRRVSAVLDRFDSTFAEAYKVNKPGFADGFCEGLPTTVGTLFRNGGYGSWWVVAAGVVVLACWWAPASQIREGRLATGHLLAAAAPLLVGVAYFPWGVFEVSAALARTGLTSPRIIGNGLGEATSPAIFGVLLSAALLAGLFLWRARSRPSG